MSAPRIVSLVPSATETVFALGMGDALVGRSHVCDAPTQALDRPILTRPRLAASSSRGIHDELRERLAEGLAIYDLDLDRLRALAPTHLLVQDQCSVCAVSPRDLQDALEQWLGARPALVRLAPHDLGDVWRDIGAIGLALDRRAQADRLRTALSERLSAVREAVGGVDRRPRVACVEWLDPPLIAGHWIPELVRIAGGEPLFGRTGGASVPVSWEDLWRARPDVIVVQACGLDLEITRREWQRLSAQALPSGPQARRPGPRVVLTDGNAFFNRPGPRLVESAEILAEILHPGRLESAAPHRDVIEWTDDPPPKTRD